MRSRPHKTKRRRRRLYKRRRRMRRKYSSGARRWRRGKNAARATKKAQARRRRSQELRAGKSKVSGWSRKTRRKKKRGGKTPSLGGNLVKSGMLAKVLCDSTEAAAVVGCEVIGLGPEDPLADICAWKLAMALSKGCKTFASEEQEVLVSEGKNIITMPLKIVKKHFSKKHKRKRGRKKYKRRISGVEI